ncbi:hypothetical protein GUJ93_ZPchr0002g23047 [Zizania palustris]|uniref:Uncharacterized protein n=1 Tax=Zizania palustris TaxID=103762 RepID=A0A8J5RG97_ZIZPA|nr:hypothetical protein GUJ93_ZPchr0002g23047 [Zizania palustris]
MRAAAVPVPAPSLVIRPRRRLDLVHEQASDARASSPVGSTLLHLRPTASLLYHRVAVNGLVRELRRDKDDAHSAVV